MAIKKILYGNKVGIIPKTVQVNQVWDDDMNEIKNVVNSNADQTTQNTNDIAAMMGNPIDAASVSAIASAVYLVGTNVQLQLNQTETNLIGNYKLNKEQSKNLYQTGLVRVDLDTSVVSIFTSDTLRITACNNILFVNEIVVDQPINKVADYLKSFGTVDFVMNSTNTPLTAGTRGVFYLGLNKLGNPVYRTNKIYDQDVCYMARVIVANTAGAYSIVTFKYIPDLASNRMNRKDRFVQQGGYIVPSGAASISFGNRAISFYKNSINYSNDKNDPNFLQVADNVGTTPMPFLFIPPNVTSLAVPLVAQTVLNPTQWYDASGAVGSGSVAASNYQVYNLLITITGNILIQTKASTSNSPAQGVNAIFSTREDALAGLDSVVFPPIDPIGDYIVLGTFYLRAGTNANGSQMNLVNDFYFKPRINSTSISSVGATVHDLLSGKNDNPAFQHVTTTDIANWNLAYNNRITSLTTTGTSGAATLVGNVLNIPIYAPQSGSANYIQNQNAVDQAASMRITGNGTFGGNITAGAIIKQGGTASQFLKADGSLDATVYAPASGGSGYIQNQTTVSQAASFRISGTGQIDSDLTLNGFLKGTVTKVLPSGATLIGQTFNITGTDATSQLINRWITNYNEDGFTLGPSNPTYDYRIVNNKTTNQPSSVLTSFGSNFTQNASGSLNFISVYRALLAGSGTGAIGTLSLYDGASGPINNTYPITNFYGLNILFTPQNNVTNAYGVKIGELYGTTSARGIDLVVSTGTGKYNIYSQGTAPNYFAGNVLIGTTTDNGSKLRVNGDIFANNGLQYGTGINITGSDLNNITNAGFYKGNNLVNAPDSGWFYITVETHDSSWIHQTITSLGSDNITNKIYTRTKTGTWGAWSEIYKVGDSSMINGTLTLHYIPKSTGANTITNSLIRDLGSGEINFMSVSGISYAFINENGVSVSIGGYNTNDGTFQDVSILGTSGIINTVFKPSGNVGIGTSSPTGKLALFAGSDTFPSISFGNYTTDGWGILERITDGDLEIRRTQSSNNFPVIRMVRTNGNVLIGTTTDTGNRLRVNGGSVRFDDLAGTGTRTVVADASGNLSTITSTVTSSGVYAPSSSVQQNITAPSFGFASYIRVGNIVHVSISLSASITSASTLTFFRVSLPIAKSSTSNSFSIGQANASYSSNNFGGSIETTNSTTEVVVTLYPPVSGLGVQNLQFTYDINQ